MFFVVLNDGCRGLCAMTGSSAVWDQRGCVGSAWLCGISVAVWDQRGCVGSAWLCAPR
jgi:hypothetical protein